MTRRRRFFALLAALMWAGCASLPQTHEAVLEAQGKPYLTFTATPHFCFKPCDVTLTAEIHGDIHWCPTSLRWIYGDGGHDEPVMNCTQRIFSASPRRYGPGEWAPSITIFSNEVAVTDPLITHVSVVIPKGP